ncbi:SGNH/GDSL hydrolase family protein [Mucilaginibacter lutimaris]|uniref:SGNH/GDSL hydrolase family protein n=1 Tax=Mucilaginibacter lutimaris TaxID=931629 RepID=A0ABW2ZAB0_9SPHI
MPAFNYFGPTIYILMQKGKITFLKRCSLLIFIAIPLLSLINQKEITWVAIGDSITYLNDHRDETKNRVKKGYLTGVTEALPYIKYINQGHNGWTVQGIAREIENLGIVKADLYTIFLGTNDWWAGIPAGTLNDYKNDTGIGTSSGAYRKIINKIRSLNPTAKIVLITPMQRNDFVYINAPNNNAYGSYKDKNGQSLASFAEAVLAIGKYENLPVVDLYHNKDLSIKNTIKFKRLKDNTGHYKNYKYPASIGIPFNPGIDDYPYPIEAQNMTFDGLHPSDRGYKVITKAIVALFKELKL